MESLPIVLAVLSDQERYGYELRAVVNEACGPFWAVDYPQLYRTLARAVDKGLATVRDQSGGRGPTRKCYAVTASGKAVVDHWLQRPTDDLDELALQLRLGLRSGRIAPRMLNTWTAALSDRRTHWKQICEVAVGTEDPGRLVSARLALRQTEAALAAVGESGAHVSDAVHAAAPLIVGSDDPLLARLSGLAGLAVRVTGSFGGLWALAQGETSVAALHLLDPDTHEYNLPYLRRAVPEEEVVLVNLAWRESGILLAPGNPCGVEAVEDLLRPDVRFINRQASAGTRLMLYLKLRGVGIDPHGVRGWQTTVATHDAMADVILAGEADAGPGLKASARARGLAFLPLVRERYDLAMCRRFYESKQAASLMDALQGEMLRRAADGLVGYDLSDSGRVVGQVH
jgi:molybdate-binding protein/DNA-binding PadR family transcriptional regulator